MYNDKQSTLSGRIWIWTLAPVALSVPAFVNSFKSALRNCYSSRELVCQLHTKSYVASQLNEKMARCDVITSNKETHRGTEQR